jgi:hypothetical protein
MAKKNKSKGNPVPANPVPTIDPGNDDLMDDLLAQLDSQDQDPVSNETSPNNETGKQGVKPRQSAKSRFQARQVSEILLRPTHV